MHRQRSRQWFLWVWTAVILFGGSPSLARADSQWLVRYTGLGNDYSSANAMVVDASGNVYITGQLWDETIIGGTGFDYATVKYDTNGNMLWAQSYNGPGNSADVPVALALDDAGNVYVAGTSIGAKSYHDYALVKYDNNGNQLWVQRYNGPVNGEDYAHAMAVDGKGNVYITGESALNTVIGYVTIKYDTNGKPLWVKRYYGWNDGGGGAYALALDAAGNVYVGGGSNGSTLVKYDSK